MKYQLLGKCWITTIFLVFLSLILNDCKSEINTNYSVRSLEVFAKSDSVDNSSIRSTEYEKFEKFLLKFCYEENFQIIRIIFPLTFIQLNEDLTEYDTVYLKKADWKYSSLGFEPNIEYRVQIYDDFRHSLNDTDERVFAIYGIRDGIERYYYFKRINGKWFLIKYEDLST